MTKYRECPPFISFQVLTQPPMLNLNYVPSFVSKTAKFALVMDYPFGMYGLGGFYTGLAPVIETNYYLSAPDGLYCRFSKEGLYHDSMPVSTPHT